MSWRAGLSTAPWVESSSCSSQCTCSGPVLRWPAVTLRWCASGTVPSVGLTQRVSACCTAPRAPGTPSCGTHCQRCTACTRSPGSKLRGCSGVTESHNYTSAHRVRRKSKARFFECVRMTLNLFFLLAIKPENKFFPFLLAICCVAYVWSTERLRLRSRRRNCAAVHKNADRQRLHRTPLKCVRHLSVPA